jgi:hypothetical protein
MAPPFFRWLILLTAFSLLVGASAAAQPAPPPPVYYPPPQTYPGQPAWAVPPPSFPVVQPARPPREAPPWPDFPWRVALEFGGSAAGLAYPSVDGRPLQRHETVEYGEELEGVADLRLTLQRVFGRWFGLGLQLSWANWQSGYLAPLGHPRSNYLALALQPELRLPIGKHCRRCVTVILGARGGPVLNLPGHYGQVSSGVDTQRGGSGLWGGFMGVECRLAQRLSLRALIGYEGAILKHEVDYGRAGSESIAFNLHRAQITVGLAVGL